MATIVKMATYKMLPPILAECKSFEVFLRKLKVWAAFTCVKAQLGMLVAESLQNSSTKFKKDLQDKMSEQGIKTYVTITRGLEIVVNWLDNSYKQHQIGSFLHKD